MMDINVTVSLAECIEIVGILSRIAESDNVRSLMVYPPKSYDNRHWLIKLTDGDGDHQTITSETIGDLFRQVADFL